MYLDRVVLKNYRCFDRAEVTLVHPQTSELRLNNLTLLLGVNGCGKSSLLLDASIEYTRLLTLGAAGALRPPQFR